MGLNDRKSNTHTFRKAFFGYERSQVEREFCKLKEDIRSYIEEIDKLRDEQLELNDKLEQYKSIEEENLKLKEELKRYKAIEEAMQQCLMLAQQTSDEIKNSAAEKAQGIISEAEKSAQKIINDANLEANKIKMAYETAKNEIYSFKAKSESLLQAQLDIIKQLAP